MFTLGLLCLVLTPVGMSLGTLVGLKDNQRLIFAPVIVAVILVAGIFVSKVVQYFASMVIAAFLNPGGAAREASPQALADSLAASGRNEEAIRAYAKLREKGVATISTLRAEAELQAGYDGDPTQAAQLFSQLRQDPRASNSDILYASHRLLDLYGGPLDNSGRVMVELRRMADNFPDTPDGQGALAELKRRREWLENQG